MHARAAARCAGRPAPRRQKGGRGGRAEAHAAHSLLAQASAGPPGLKLRPALPPHRTSSSTATDRAPEPPAHLGEPRSALRPAPGLSEASPTTEAAPASKRGPRVSTADLELLQRAERVTELPGRIRMALQRDLSGNKLPADAVQRHTDARYKGQRMLSFLQDWAAGLIPDTQPTASQSLSLEVTHDDEDVRGWLNLPELTVHMGAHVSDSMRSYVQKLWKVAGKGPERAHPDGSSPPRQRRFWLASFETARVGRKNAFLVDIKGEVEGPTDLAQLIEQLQAPVPLGAAAAADALPLASGEEDELAEQPRAPKRARAAAAAEASGEPSTLTALTRGDLLQELYKVICRVYTLHDKLGTGSWADVARQRIKPHIEELLQSKQLLEHAEGALVPQQLLERQGRMRQAGEVAAKAAKGLQLHMQAVKAFDG